MAANIEELVRTYDRHMDRRRPWESVWQELGEYTLPPKSQITTKRTGAKLNTQVYDSTAIHANVLLASSMQGSLTNSALKWFSLRMRDDELNEVADVAAWLDDCANRMYRAIQQSNFNQEIQEVYLDLGAFGVGAMLIDVRDPARGGRFGGLRFESLALGSYAIDEDATGRVDTLYRSFELTARVVVDRWGADTVGEKIREIAERDPVRLLTICHGVYPRKGSYGRTARKKPFASCYFSKDFRVLLAEGGYDEFPYIAPRWTKVSGEVYGRGPGHAALPDVRTLNKAKELLLKLAAKKLDPPLKVRDDGVIGNVRLQPGGQTVVRTMDDIAVMDFGGDVNFQQLVLGELRAAIRETFFWDQLQLPAQGGSLPMTATEVERRWETMQRILGPNLGRFESEALSPGIDRIFALMLRAGQLPPPPPIVLEAARAGAGDIDVHYEGPLARAQRASDVASLQRAVAAIAPLVQADPNVIDEFDLGKAARMAWVASGASPLALRDPQQVAEIKEARLAAQQEEAAKADEAAVMEGAGKLAPLVKDLAQPAEAPAA